MANACYRPDANYLPASFKGVSFEVESSSSDHGRRGDEGEFPWGESTAYVDMGRRIRTYSINGVFRDNDHVTAAAALIAAVESAGPGTLVHPTRGVLTVACRSLHVEDDQKSNAGVTTFTAEFVEANEWGSGFIFGDDVYGLDILTVIGEISSSFVSLYSPKRDQWYYRDEVVGVMADEVLALRNSYQDVTRAGRTSEQNKVIADFNAVMNDEYIVADPDTASLVVRNGYAYIDTEADTGDQKISAILSVINNTPESNVTGRAADSVNVIYSLVRGVGAAYLARAYLETDPDTFDQAYSQYLKVMAIIDQEMEYADNCVDPALYLALKKFRVEAGRALMDRAYNSPALVTYHFGGGVPSLVAAWEIFGDATRYTEIELRNTGMPWALGPNIVAART